MTKDFFDRYSRVLSVLFLLSFILGITTMYSIKTNLTGFVVRDKFDALVQTSVLPFAGFVIFLGSFLVLLFVLAYHHREE